MMSTELSPLPAIQKARRVILVANGRSGKSAGDTQGLVEALRAEGCTVDAWNAAAPKELQALTQRARAAGADAIVACGGDGTVNTVANALAGTEIALGILPLGTFNYVARLYGIPEDPAEAAALIAHGQPRRIAAGSVNGRLFLNNFSFGLYTDIIQARERHKAAWGRHRGVAVISALATSLRSRARVPLLLHLDTVEPAYRGRASLFFAGVNPAQFAAAGLELAQAVREEALGIVLIRAIGPLSILKMLLSAAVSDPERLAEVNAWPAQSATVQVPRAQIRGVIDGELISLRPPLQLSFQREALNLLAPQQV